MLTEVTLMPMIKVLDPVAKSVIIDVCTSIQKDGTEIARTCDSMTFQAGDLDGVKAFLNEETGAEIDYLTAIWA